MPIVLRFDDIHPRMHRDNLIRVINIMDKYGLCGIAAVVPECKDESIIYDFYDVNFWSTINRIQNQGWSIALHGLTHKLFSSRTGYLFFTKKSEFSGLDLNLQNSMIHSGKNILLQKNIYPELFIAPAHSFDLNTLEALKRNKLNVISDGIALFPFYKYGVKFLPQQLWKLRAFRVGYWTICLHPSNWGVHEFSEFELFIKKHHKKIIKPVQLIDFKPRFYHRILNVIFWFIYVAMFRLKMR